MAVEYDAWTFHLTQARRPLLSPEKSICHSDELVCRILKAKMSGRNGTDLRHPSEVFLHYAKPKHIQQIWIHSHGWTSRRINARSATRTQHLIRVKSATSWSADLRLSQITVSIVTRRILPTQLSTKWDIFWTASTTGIVLNDLPVDQRKKYCLRESRDANHNRKNIRYARNIIKRIWGAND